MLVIRGYWKKPGWIPLVLASLTSVLSGCDGGATVSTVTPGSETRPAVAESTVSSRTVDPTTRQQEKEDKTMKSEEDSNAEWKVATFGNGCYWCTEAVFQRVKGVKKVVSGFSGGHVDDPTYYEVCQGTTGHAEVLQITYDPAQVSFEKLLEVFWKTHDPTTLNRQGNDVGPQYRSAIFYHDDQQRDLAQKYKKKLDQAGAFDDPIVTEITEFEKFYPAPAKHQNYYNQNKTDNPYCQLITYKLEKFRKAFGDVIDEEKDVVK